MGIFGRKWSDVAQIVGAGLQDISDTDRDNLGRVSRQMAERRKEDEAKAQRDQVAQSIAALGPNPSRVDLIRALGPALIGQGNYGALAGLAPEAREPTYQQNKMGWWEVGAGGPPKLAVPFPEEAPKPEGDAWTLRDPVTGAVTLRPGAVEALAALSGTKREAITSRPMPRAPARGRSGGKAPSTKLPSGFILD